MKEIAIFTDIDGCLVPDHGHAPPGYMESLRNLSDFIKRGNAGLGPTLRFCSGRELGYLDAVSKIIGSPRGRGIAENGVLLCDLANGQYLINPQMSSKAIRVFRNLMDKAVPDILAQLSNDVFQYPGMILTPVFIRRDSSKKQLPELNTAIKGIIEQYYKGRLVRMTRSKISVNAEPRFVNKGTAVRYLADLEGISLRRSLGIGDTIRDKVFLQEIGYVACPANADYQLRRYIRQRRNGFVSLKSYAAGVIDCIDNFMAVVKP